MSVKLDVDVAEGLPPGLYLPAAETLQRWADSACALADEVEASLRIVGSEESRMLNRDYRDSDRPTNVLSFPMDMPAGMPSDIGPALLGDLAVCAEVVAREADEQGKPADAHWAHMIVHGMLHLQGYDHVKEQDAERMETREIDILQGLGFGNPYINDA